MKRFLLVLILAVLGGIGCGHGNDVTLPPEDPGPTPTPWPAWRMDRSDAVNWMLGHRQDNVWLWPWSDTTQGHGMIPIFDIHQSGQSRGWFIWLKRVPDNYERFEYDGANIYWREDHGYKGLGYTWDNVIWTSRRIRPGGSAVPNTENRIHWHRDHCGDGIVNRYPVYTTTYPMAMRDFGGVVGVAEALHVSFQVGGSPFVEHYFYTWDWGWVRWEYWRNGEPKSRHISNFNTPIPGSFHYDTPCSENARNW